MDFVLTELTDEESRSLRARGLKRDGSNCSCAQIKVALFTGAWIETIFLKARRSAPTASRSLRARGLKRAKSKK